MTRKFKALGLAIVAALALSAVVASMGQAENNEKSDFWTAVAPSEVHGTNAGELTEEPGGIGVGIHTFNFPGLPTLTCHEVRGTGTLPKEQKELTGEKIEYKKCHAISFGLTLGVTVDMNNCHFLFTTETFTKNGTGGTGESHGSVHIQCPVGKEITITVFQPFDPKHEKLRCTLHIPPQWIKTGISYRNELTEGVHAVTVTATNAPVTTTLTKSAEAPCNVHSHQNATYNGSFWMRAT
jgi:hypothetical protein